MPFNVAGAASVVKYISPTLLADRRRYCLKDDEVLGLADMALKIEEQFSQKAGRPKPMDIEWAKDGVDGQLYILQARPETVASRRMAGDIETWRLRRDLPSLVVGKAIGEKIATGKVRIIDSERDLAAFQNDEVLVASTTSPDWEAVMKRAAAIVTDHGGRTCHAAILARELGVPAVVGTGRATSTLASGQLVTVSCAAGDVGNVYEGEIPFVVERTSAAELRPTRTQIMLNLANPETAFKNAVLPVGGVGLARMEFIMSGIGAHPMALAHPERVTSKHDRATIQRLAKGYASPAEYFIAQLAEGVGMIAAAFYPRPVIARLSDFKTNEYTKLAGGRDFEPKEANPMLGFRGASRYVHQAYADGFALECQALNRVRETMGLANLSIMVPFCRRVDEARLVLKSLAANGLVQGRDGLEIFVMCEIPNCSSTLLSGRTRHTRSLRLRGTRTLRHQRNPD
jgi:pyruvate,water dikinase